MNAINIPFVHDSCVEISDKMYSTATCSVNEILNVWWPLQLMTLIKLTDIAEKLNLFEDRSH